MTTLLVYHYHFRPGGVRSVIERGLLEWCSHRDWERVVLVTGEAPPAAWTASLAQRLGPVTLEIVVDARLGYLSELGFSSEISREMSILVTTLLQKFQPNLIWAHNLSLGRNVSAGLAWGRASQDAGVRLVCHDHDWWVQHRWERWQEMTAWEGDSLALAAEATFPTGPQIRHVVVHPQDAQVLGSAVHWLANPVPRASEMVVAPAEAARAHAALRGLRFWFLPARVLRRKNLLEAALLTKLLCPEITTLLVAGPASPAEQPYAQAAMAGAALLGLDLRLNVAPELGLSVPALMQPAEMVLQTSVQEGFGLTALEAPQQGKPLILRRLPLVTPWLVQQGGYFPHCYDQLRLPESAVPPHEHAAWQKGWQQQRCPLLPAAWRSLAEATGAPNFSHFSGLSVAGQLTVLKNFPQLETELRHANPWLDQWAGTLAQPATAPQCSGDWPQQMDALWTNPPAATGTALEHLETLFRAHLTDAAAWPMLW